LSGDLAPRTAQAAARERETTLATLRGSTFDDVTVL
jgi:hypothetical protein